MEIVLLDHHFDLLPERAIFWKERSALILSDLHFGKTAHFRKGGIAIPENLFADDLNTLNCLVDLHTPTSLIIVGDMFHSQHNSEVELFGAWRKAHEHIAIHLAKGNHDILKRAKYDELAISVSNTYTFDGFAFSHEPCNDTAPFCFSGHIHPGVRIDGSARQSLKFPCFHFTGSCCTLPAFSKFTGLSIIKPVVGDKVFAITGKEVMQCL